MDKDLVYVSLQNHCSMYVVHIKHRIKCSLAEKYEFLNFSLRQPTFLLLSCLLKEIVPKALSKISHACNEKFKCRGISVNH